MSIHEYIFVTISIVYGLAIARALNRILGFIRVRSDFQVPLASWFWTAGVLVSLVWFIWIGFSLQAMDAPGYGLFAYLLLTTTSLYGATEFALPKLKKGSGTRTDFDRDIRISAMFLTAYLLLITVAHVYIGGALLGGVFLQASVGLVLAALLSLRPQLLSLIGPAYFLYAVIVHSPLQRLVGLTG